MSLLNIDVCSQIMITIASTQNQRCCYSVNSIIAHPSRWFYKISVIVVRLCCFWPLSFYYFLLKKEECL